MPATQLSVPLLPAPMAPPRAFASVLPQVPAARHSHVPVMSGRRRFVVAASPPVEEAVRATDMEPLTKEDLVSYFASGCKARCDWRIGTEHEKFGFQVETLRPINYSHISELLNGIGDRFGWHKVMEGNNVIGLKQAYATRNQFLQAVACANRLLKYEKEGGMQNISLEAGGQLELSGAPVETLHQTCAEINSHLYQVKAVGKEMGIGFLGLGFQPKWDLSDMPMMPKARYQICKNYMPKVGSFGLDVMFRTCSVQVNLDFSSEEDMIVKFRAGIALQPIATAIFANSPFKDGNLSGFRSLRSHIYTDCDDHRTGMLPFVFDSSFGFERYVDYALDVPMIFVYRDKRHIDCTGMSFRDFMVGKLPQMPGVRPTLKDWEYHLGTIHTEVRMKKFLEMRGADCDPLSKLCAVPAFWVGLLYDGESLRTITDMISDWTNEEREMLRRKVPINGLMTPFRGGYVKDVAEDIVELAKNGLRRRGQHEVGYLNEVDEIVRTGVAPAEKLAYLFKTRWQRKVDPVFHELAY